LDRDGTINEEVNYLDDPDRFKLLPGTADAIRKINQSSIRSVVVSNQSGVARGYFSEDLVNKVHRKMRDLLKESGAFLDGIYYCPHHPDFGESPYRKVCNCRKPAVGMLEKAAKDLKIDIAYSYTVGDKLEDIILANRAGAKGILVLTGFGKDELKRFHECSKEVQQPSFVAKDLSEAVKWILEDYANLIPQKKIGLRGNEIH